MVRSAQEWSGDLTGAPEECCGWKPCSGHSCVINSSSPSTSQWLKGTQGDPFYQRTKFKAKGVRRYSLPLVHLTYQWGQRQLWWCPQQTPGAGVPPWNPGSKRSCFSDRRTSVGTSLTTISQKEGKSFQGGHALWNCPWLSARQYLKEKQTETDYGNSGRIQWVTILKYLLA